MSHIYVCVYMCICICTGGWMLDVNIGKIITRKDQLVIATSTIAINSQKISSTVILNSKFV